VNQPVLVNFVLDKSGSMHNLQRSTIDGFNSFLHDQRQQQGVCKMSLTQFDTSFQVDYVAEDIWRVPMLDTMRYRPSGGTALLDAVGTTIKGAEQWLENQKVSVRTFGTDRVFTADPGYKVLVVVFTDGEENSSKEWHINQPLIAGDDKDVGGLIQWKQAEGWEFLFLGTGGSGWLERTFGAYVAHDHFVGYAATNDAHTHTYAGLSSTTSTLRSTGNVDTSHMHQQ
jgi:hypothetical protein